MGEGSLYDRELAALAIVQARGDLIEAIFLVRAYRTTLPRFGYSTAVDTGKMLIERRISATFKDLPGGQLLGPTFDYTHRLLDPSIAEGTLPDDPVRREGQEAHAPRVTDLLDHEGLIEPDGLADGEEVGDLTRNPLEFPLIYPSPRAPTLPVRIFTYIEQTFDPLVTAVCSVLILLTLAAIVVVERGIGLGRLFGADES